MAPAAQTNIRLMQYPHDFQRIRGTLHCEQVPLPRLAKAVGTPVYVYSYQTLVDHFRKLTLAFEAVQPLICFSMKANSTLAIVRLLVKEGAGLDIVSGGELFKALKAGCPPSRIVFASVGKRREEIEEALRVGIFCFNVESLPELEVIDRIARTVGTVARVALRINPDVEASTHHYITTGIAESKFGIDPRTARRILRRAVTFAGVRIVGLHLHIGSQIVHAKPFIRAIQRIVPVVEGGRRLGIPLAWLNLGGGLGIIYKDEQPQTPEQFASAILPLIQALDLRLILEPGRFIVGNAGVLVTEVLYVKASRGKRFVVVDAGMNDLIRPALYDAYHEGIPAVTARSTRAGEARYDIVGPVCESADVLGRGRQLGVIAPGEFLVVLGAGAYGSTMASNYNGRLRAAEVLVRGARWELIRHRDTLPDLIRHDRIPSRLLAGVR